jgi:lysine 2,3-aminomutase
VAGQKRGVFRELIGSFLTEKIREAEERYGAGSAPHRALTLQYVKDAHEDHILVDSERRRHYEAELLVDSAGEPLVGVERLYRRTALLVPTTVCAAHCRWCLRGQYPTSTLTEDQIVRAARFFGSPAVRDDLREILITGGDPFMVRALLAYALDQIVAHAPNIEIVRIGTRVPFQAPDKVNPALLAALGKHKQLRVEIGTHVNHPIEFWPESVAALKMLQDHGLRIYNQHPLLRGVNDDLSVLTELYDLLRHHDIEAHYIFHCVPMRGMQHHRTTVDEGLQLVRRLVSSGGFSGRTKPQYFAMTDLGKVPFYEGTILERKDGRLLLQTGYSLEERRRWNPSWPVPDSAIVDADGLLNVWYLDGPATARPAMPEGSAKSARQAGAPH